MAFMLYEIWEEDTEGRQTLIDTAGNLTEAKRIGKTAIDNGANEIIIFEDDNSDEVFEVARLKKS